MSLCSEKQPSEHYKNADTFFPVFGAGSAELIAGHRTGLLLIFKHICFKHESKLPDCFACLCAKLCGREGLYRQCNPDHQEWKTASNASEDPISGEQKYERQHNFKLSV